MPHYQCCYALVHHPLLIYDPLVLHGSYLIDMIYIVILKEP